jgi:hypothetical protein
MEQLFCSDKKGGVIFTLLFDPGCSRGNTTAGSVAESGASCRNAGVARMYWEKGDKLTHCNRNLIALIILFALTGHRLCFGQDVPCCFWNGSCDDMPRDFCLSNNGRIGGPGTHCDDVVCAEDWACCFPDGSCRDLAEPWCSEDGGFPVEGEKCTSDFCKWDVPCCFWTGGCDDMPMYSCLKNNGRIGGPGTYCDDVVCAEDWACCFPDGSCQNWAEPWCSEDGGSPVEGIKCMGDLNNDGLDDACFKPPDCLGDLNDDGSVSLSDRMYIDSLLMQVGYPYRIYEGDSLWDASADLNSDGVISLADRMVIDGILMQVGPPYISPC